MSALLRFLWYSYRSAHTDILVVIQERLKVRLSEDKRASNFSVKMAEVFHLLSIR